MKTALVTGITGQDGSYLARLLIENGYKVYGACRRSASINAWRLHELDIARQVELVTLELLEFTNILRVIEQIAPDEIYNLAAQSFVAVSFDQPLYTSDVNAFGPARILEALRYAKADTRFYQASTSEIFGKVTETPQTENTALHPRSPYGAAKAYAHHLTINYREAFGIHASSGILFNHESPLRGIDFVTRKITASLAQIKHGRQEILELGNLESKRDWGFAPDYVHGMWLMLQHDIAQDFVLATGESHSVREFVDLAARITGIDLAWEGEGIDTEGIDRATGKTIVRVDRDYYRPSDVDLLIGDANKARTTLGWQPEIGFGGLVQQMMEADLRRAKEGVIVQ